jgi:hypothetical protein
MTRLIDADALKEYIDCGHLRSPAEVCFSERDVVDLIDAQPTVDAVPVIRCKDCIHHHGYICDRMYGLQDAFTLQDNDYCSRAEPKETS